MIEVITQHWQPGEPRSNWWDKPSTGNVDPWLLFRVCADIMVENGDMHPHMDIHIQMITVYNKIVLNLNATRTMMGM